MVQGFDRRDETQDPNASPSAAPVQSNPLPMGQVLAPRNSSFNGVGKGEEDLASILSQAGPLLQNYVDAKKPEWRMDGMLAQQQGKTLDEIQKSGNMYTVQGFQGMAATTALQDIYTAKIVGLENGDNQTDPTEYRKGLASTFAKMSENVTDPYVKQLVVSHADDMLPKLLQQQMLSNAKWKQEQTFNNFVAQAASTADYAKTPGADPNRLPDLITHAEAMSGLKKDQANKALAEAAALFQEAKSGLWRK